MIGNWNDQNIEITSPPVPLGHPEAFHYYQKEYGTIPSTTRSWNSYGMPWFVRYHYGKMPLTALLVAKSYVTATQEAKMLSWNKQCVVSTDALRISMWKATSEIQHSKKIGSNHCMKFFSRLIRVNISQELMDATIMHAAPSNCICWPDEATKVVANSSAPNKLFELW